MLTILQVPTIFENNTVLSENMFMTLRAPHIVNMEFETAVIDGILLSNQWDIEILFTDKNKRNSEIMEKWIKEMLVPTDQFKLSSYAALMLFINTGAEDNDIVYASASFMYVYPTNIIEIPRTRIVENTIKVTFKGKCYPMDHNSFNDYLKTQQKHIRGI